MRLEDGTLKRAVMYLAACYVSAGIFFRVCPGSSCLWVRGKSRTCGLEGFLCDVPRDVIVDAVFNSHAYARNLRRRGRVGFHKYTGRKKKKKHLCNFKLITSCLALQLEAYISSLYFCAVFVMPVHQISQQGNVFFHLQYFIYLPHFICSSYDKMLRAVCNCS